MRIFTVIGLALCLLLPLQTAYAAFATYGQRLCHSDVDVLCLTVKKGDTWASLWPDAADREKAMLVNRITTRLQPGMQLVIPDDMDEADINRLLPFPQDIGYQNERSIIVSPRHLVWAAYEADGKLVRWGPASTGRNYCPDIDANCATPRGIFTIYRTAGENCASTKYPIPDGGAPMPYCMFFKGGFAIHGSNDLPGYNASHGCVRTLTRDAKWLNQEFITIGVTKVIVKND